MKFPQGGMIGFLIEKRGVQTVTRVLFLLINEAGQGEGRLNGEAVDSQGGLSVYFLQEITSP